MKTIIQEIDMETGRDNWNDKLVTEEDFQNTESEDEEDG